MTTSKHFPYFYSTTISVPENELIDVKPFIKEIAGEALEDVQGVTLPIMGKRISNLYTKWGDGLSIHLLLPVSYFSHVFFQVTVELASKLINSSEDPKDSLKKFFRVKFDDDDAPILEFLITRTEPEHARFLLSGDKTLGEMQEFISIPGTYISSVGAFTTDENGDIFFLEVCGSFADIRTLFENMCSACLSMIAVGLSLEEMEDAASNIFDKKQDDMKNDLIAALFSGGAFMKDDGVVN